MGLLLTISPTRVGFTPFPTRRGPPHPTPFPVPMFCSWMLIGARNAMVCSIHVVKAKEAADAAGDADDEGAKQQQEKEKEQEQEEEEEKDTSDEDRFADEL